MSSSDLGRVGQVHLVELRLQLHPLFSDFACFSDPPVPIPASHHCLACPFEAVLHVSITSSSSSMESNTMTLLSQRKFLRVLLQQVNADKSLVDSRRGINHAGQSPQSHPCNGLGKEEGNPKYLTNSTSEMSTTISSVQSLSHVQLFAIL